MSYNILLFFLSYFILITNQNPIILNLSEYNVHKISWEMNQTYIYYLDISNYKLEEENIIQIYNQNTNALQRINMMEINESYIIDNNSDINIIENIPALFHFKYKLNPKRYYYEALIKKREKNQKYFALLVNPNLEINKTECELIVSSKIPYVNVKRKEIDNGNYFSQIYQVHPKIEKLIKYNISDISLENSNLILFTLYPGVSTLYFDNITSLDKKTNLFIKEKNSTKESNFIIYLSLLGQVVQTKFQIILDNHDVAYIYSNARYATSFYLERLDCSKDYYILESYYSLNDIKASEKYRLDINPIYGDYQIFYFDSFFSNINEIFEQNDIIIEKIEGIMPVMADLSCLKITCKTPTLLNIKYIQQNINLNISEGKEITCSMERNYFPNNFIFITEPSKAYQFNFGFYKNNINVNYETNFFDDNKKPNSKSQFISTLKNITEFSLDLYFQNDLKNYFEFSIQTHHPLTNFKLFLISDQYYRNIVEGLTDITNEKAIAFKVRKDIIFDYFIFRIFSEYQTISILYELKIVEKRFIKNNKVMQGINGHFLVSRNGEIYLRFSNPYDKFNSRVKEDDQIYLLAEIKNFDKFPSLYVDVRYYYNDSVISIEQAKPKILINKNEYKIYGKEDNNKIKTILLNANKCNDMKNYSMKTFYENNNNLIYEENIINKRTFLFHNNLFNNTKIIINEKENKDNNTFTDNKIFMQASYYQNGDIYMNYFPLKEEFNNNIKITQDFSIAYEDTKNEIKFKWNDYLLSENKDIYPVNYSLYILPKNSPINSICQMSLIPPNISLINKNNYLIDLEQGDYKINIIASVVNDNLPLVTLYDFLNFNVPKRYNIKLIVILTISGVIIAAAIVLFIIYLKKRSKNKEEVDLSDVSRKERFLSLLGLSYDNEGIIFDNDDEPHENNINEKENEENNDSGDNELKNDSLEEDFNNFSMESN